MVVEGWGGNIVDLIDDRYQSTDAAIILLVFSHRKHVCFKYKGSCVRLGFK